LGKVELDLARAGAAGVGGPESVLECAGTEFGGTANDADVFDFAFVVDREIEDDGADAGAWALGAEGKLDGRDGEGGDGESEDAEGGGG